MLDITKKSVNILISEFLRQQRQGRGRIWEERMPLTLYYYQSDGEKRKGERRVKRRERDGKRKKCVLGYDSMSPNISIIISVINLQRLRNYKRYESVHSQSHCDYNKAALESTT